MRLHDTLRIRSEQFQSKISFAKKRNKKWKQKTSYSLTDNSRNGIFPDRQSSAGFSL